MATTKNVTSRSSSSSRVVNPVDGVGTEFVISPAHTAGRLAPAGSSVGNALGTPTIALAICGKWLVAQKVFVPVAKGGVWVRLRGKRCRRGGSAKWGGGAGIGGGGALGWPRSRILGRGPWPVAQRVCAIEATDQPAGCTKQGARRDPTPLGIGNFNLEANDA